MNILKVIYTVLNVFMLCLGSIIGVGFLSGAEIWIFFVRFGENFVIAIVVLFVILSIFCYKIINLNGCENKLQKMQKMLRLSTKNTKFNKKSIKNFLLNLEILMFAAAMFSGLKNVIYELFINNQNLIYILAIMMVFLLTVSGIKAISKFNILMIFSFFVILIMLCMSDGAGLNGSWRHLTTIAKVSFSGAGISTLYVFMYVFMNISHLVPIFKIEKLPFNKKGNVIFSLLFSFVFCLVVLVMVLFLSKNSFLTNSSMPLLEFFKSVGGFENVFYVVVLIGGLLSTLLVCLSGLKFELKDKVKNNFLASYLVILLPLIFGFLPFGFFINFVYPLAGVINFVALTFL